MATKVKGEAIKDGSIPLSALSSEIINKLGNDKYKKLDWYYSDNAGSYIAESQTNKIFINEKEYDLTEDPVTIAINNKEYGFGHNNYYGGPHVVVYGADDSDVDILTNNVFILNESTSASTPDWNAQEGESGYIENKPFRIIKSNNGEITNINSYFIRNENEFYPTNDLYIKYNNKKVLLAKEKQELYWGDGVTLWVDLNCFFLVDDANSNIIVNSDGNVDFELIIALNSEFIPDTIIKTTPQTLTDNAKNQALANLGIDPVVWKYIQEPFIIKYLSETGEITNSPIPIELYNIIWDEDNKCLRNIVCKVLMVKVTTVDDISIESVTRILDQTYIITAQNNKLTFDPVAKNFYE